MYDVDHRDRGEKKNTRKPKTPFAAVTSLPLAGIHTPNSAAHLSSRAASRDGISYDFWAATGDPCLIGLGSKNCRRKPVVFTIGSVSFFWHFDGPLVAYTDYLRYPNPNCFVWMIQSRYLASSWWGFVGSLVEGRCWVRDVWWYV